MKTTLHSNAWKSDHWLQSIMDQYESGIIITDLQYNVLKWNVAAERFCSNADGSFAERGFIEFLHPAGNGQQSIYHELERLIRKKSLDEHIVVTGPAGKTALLSCYLHKVPEMKPLSAVVIIIRELAEYLQDASGREVMFRSFLNTSSSPGWISDEDGKMIYINQAARDLYRISDDYQYKSVHDLFPAPVAEDYIASDQLVLQSGEALNQVVQSKYGEGAGRYYMVHKFLLDVPYTKKLVGGQAIDITAEKEAQEQIIREITEKKRLEAELLHQKANEQKQINLAMIEAQDHERNELSKELHENVNQMLSSAMVLMSSVNVGGSEEDQAYFEKSKQYLDRVLQEIRKLSRSLNTSVIEEVGLKTPVEEVISNMKSVLSIDVQLDFDSFLEDVLTYEQKLTAYRIVQEHTNNIIRHSRAGKAIISLLGNEEQLVLRIQDDGVGFDLDKTGRGLGLINIRNRVETHNGTLNIETSPSNGCLLEVIIPVKNS
jgi:PAS domain S-box-containing protein